MAIDLKPRNQLVIFKKAVQRVLDFFEGGGALHLIEVGNLQGVKQCLQPIIQIARLVDTSRLILPEKRDAKGAFESKRVPHERQALPLTPHDGLWQNTLLPSGSACSGGRNSGTLW